LGFLRMARANATRCFSPVTPKCNTPHCLRLATILVRKPPLLQE
jgi:hypothetical protein